MCFAKSSSVSVSVTFTFRFVSLDAADKGGKPSAQSVRCRDSSVGGDAGVQLSSSAAAVFRISPSVQPWPCTAVCGPVAVPVDRKSPCTPHWPLRPYSTSRGSSHFHVRQNYIDLRRMRLIRSLIAGWAGVLAELNSQRGRREGTGKRALGVCVGYGRGVWGGGAGAGVIACPRLSATSVY